MSPKHVKVEISSEEDVEFYYKCVIDFSMYDTLKMANGLADNVQFTDASPDLANIQPKDSRSILFEEMLKNLLQDCAKDPKQYRIHFTLDDDTGKAYLRFKHDSEFNESLIMSLPMK